MLYSPSIGFASRRRRRRELYWRLARHALMLGTLAVAAGYAYQVGASKAEAVIGQLRAEIELLRASNTSLAERVAAAVQRADAAESRAQAIQERYEAEVPRGIERELLDRVERRLAAGVPPERLAFVIEQSGREGECDGEPETKRFLVRTPLSQGPVGAVRFGDGRIVVTGEGASARNDRGQPEAWFDPAAPITLRVQTIGGQTEVIEGVLPINHAIVVGGREYRFNVIGGERRGFVEATAQGCAFP